MLRRTLALVFFIFYLSVYVSVADNEFSHCDDEGFWSVQNILETQKICDFFIAIAYFSIPVELLYFISFSNVPFKWVLVQFIAFIVLCGLTHLLNGWTYNVHHSFQLMLALTIAKFSTAFVSCATAITLLTLIPLILKIKVREVFLTKNVLELNQEVGMMKRQKEVSWHVRMLTRKIRKSLDKHTILYTTLVELSKTLGLHNCAVWMPNENRTQMILTHELKKGPSRNYHRAISFEDPDVLDIKGNKGVTILRAESALSIATCSESGVSGTVAAIRLPMLRVSNFKGGTPQLVDTSFAILVLVPTSTNSGSWTCHEMEIVEVVADQVAVALSHADVLEESQVMRKKLSEQNVALQQAKKNAIMACKAWASFQKVMSPGMRRPMHSILGLISMFQEENLNLEQNIIIDTMAKISSVISTLINDAMISTKDNERFSLEVRPFDLHSMIREAACLVKCMSVYEGFTYEIEVHKSLPNQVIGDEKRAFQVILHMVGYLLSIYNGNGKIIFRISPENNIEDDKLLGFWTPSIPDGFVFVNFEFETEKQQCFSMDGSISNTHMIVRRHNNEIKENLSFRMCKKIVQMMQGNIWISPNAVGFAQSMTLVLRFQIRPSIPRAFLIPGISLDHSNPNPHFRELRVLLADDDFVNRTVTKKLLEKLGCQVTAVSSGFECLNAIQTDKKYFRIVVLDLHMPEMDGFELAMRIRNSCIHNLPLIIAVTASAENNVWERCLQIGMNGLIRKPVLLQGMADELQRVMQWAGEGL